MSWRRESSALAREVAALVVDGSSAWLTAGELEQALAVRRDLLLLLSRVASEIRRAPPSAGAPGPVTLDRLSRRAGITAAQLETDPVRALEQALVAHPAPKGRHPAGGAGNYVPAEATGWAAVGRRTELATQAWWRVRPAMLAGEERWSAVADVAALAEAVAVLDRQLLTAARLPARLGRAAMWALEDAVAGGLRLAAREAAEVAATGPLPDWDQPGDRPAVEPVMLVRSVQDLAAVQDRLVTQLAAAGSVSPQAAVLIASGQARLLAAAATPLNESPRYAQQGRWAADLSRRVADSVLGAEALAAAGDGRYPARAVTQSRELAGFVTGRMSGAALSEPDRAALAAAVARAPRVLGALARQADRAWRTGQWLVPNPRGEALTWVPAGSMDREPRLCARLSAVAASSVARPGAVAVAGPARSGPTPPREILAHVGRVRRPARPPLPGQRTTEVSDRS